MLVSFVLRDSVAERPMGWAVSRAGPEQANDRGSRFGSWCIVRGMDDASRKAADAEASSPPQEPVGPQESARLLGRYGRRFSAGETLFQEGTPAAEAFLVHDGRVRLLKRVAMADRSLAVLKEGDLFGEAALIEGTTYGSTAVGLTDGVILALDRKTFRGLLEKHPTVASRVIDQLVRRMRDAEDQIETMILRGVQTRVTSALLKLAGRATGGAEVTISPVELSARVGLDVEAVKRTVQRLRDRQYVRIMGERIEIPDIDALRRLYTLLGTKDDLAGPETP
jgi:CRP/FNR family transcriptional regulator, cyclic AMP receptor protein